MAKIPVVDDSNFDRTLIDGVLRRERDLKVSFAANGRDALGMIEELQPDLIVTDLMMPEMDGLQLVQRCRQDNAGIPVIVITSAGSEYNAMEALGMGATSFVPKMRLTDLLASTIHQVLALKQPSHAFHQLVACLSSAAVAFNLRNDIRLFPIVVDLIQKSLSSTGYCDATEAIRLSLAIEEALLNALVHGNLELTAETSREGIRPEAEFFKKRLVTAPYCERSLSIKLDLSEKQLEFFVRDEGPGFDTSTIPRVDELHSLRDGVGRGFLLMQLFMDVVEFNSRGNELRLVRYFDKNTRDPSRNPG
jgi:CheY-like chemotaxis protein/anti-sigma regulatory factor (Ser/Thr protein kinase)